MNLGLYAILSAIIIFIWYFAFGMKAFGEERDFNFFLLIAIFVFGGFFGYFMQSIEIALLISIVLALVFI